jgi:hypothetical protein
LTIGILDEFIGFGLPTQFPLRVEYPIHQVAKDGIKKKKKKGE